jgi:putative transposase
MQIDESNIQAYLEKVVRTAVEEMLNALLDAEADHLCRAKRHERTCVRKDTRAGSYERTLHTRVGDVTLQVPRLRRLLFETAIIERYRRCESFVEEALTEMYLAGASIHRAECVTLALWDTHISTRALNDLNRKICMQIELCRRWPLKGQFPHVFLDGLWLRRTRSNETKNIPVLVAAGVTDTGHRQILAVSEGEKENKASWTAFLRMLKERELRGVKLFVSDRYPGLPENLGALYPEASWDAAWSLPVQHADSGVRRLGRKDRNGSQVCALTEKSTRSGGKAAQKIRESKRDRA